MTPEAQALYENVIGDPDKELRQQDLDKLVPLLIKEGWNARKAVDVEIALQADEFILDPDKLPETIAQAIREKE